MFSVVRFCGSSPFTVYNEITTISRRIVVSQVQSVMLAPKKQRLERRRRINMSTEMPIGDTQTQTRPSVCRRLFPDAEENEAGFIDNFRNQFLDKLREDQEAAKLKWNFDFANETPLEGRWEWERIGVEMESSLPVTGENEVVLENNRTNTREQSEQVETRTEEQLASKECRPTLH